jgi:hypothetical protein
MPSRNNSQQAVLQYKLEREWKYDDTWTNSCEVMGKENTGYLELTLEVLKQYEDGIVRMNRIKKQ